ncbi:hypothetical protein [Amycolatopsis sp. cg13]
MSAWPGTSHSALRSRRGSSAAGPSGRFAEQRGRRLGCADGARRRIE